jgi:RHS repeat-associated protein
MTSRTTHSRITLLLCAAFSRAAVAVDYEQVVYYHTDPLGSPIAATDASGELLWRERYAPFGSRLLYESRETDCGGSSCVPVESPWDEKQWYTGKLEETRTGLQYFGARWYEPEIGRFLSADPVRFREHDVFSFNRYAYANNNPYRYLDPDGREVAQAGFSFRMPRFFGLVQEAMGREISVSGVSFGLAWSYPDSRGNGEYDVGAYLSTSLQGEGVGTGRMAVTYSESVHGEKSVKDLAGVGGAASIDLGGGGLNAGYNERGLETVGIHIGPGVGVSVQAEATALISARHGRVGWHENRETPRAPAERDKRDRRGE